MKRNDSLVLSGMLDYYFDSGEKTVSFDWNYQVEDQKEI